ncbi:hypothetical protein Taro_007743 [Colocasia esculenta]|uniref:Uncharacterized protein n=1 Tax=Colocasia esculenta TaxID=4460 RepID=A0A843TZ36_COLES|nr:hypothetical protein [Colocasia esculenta]
MENKLHKHIGETSNTMC